MTTADSEESLSSKLSVAASVNLNFNAFSADVKGAYNSSSGTSNTKQYAVKRMKSYQYTREIDFMNIIAMAESSEEMEAKLLAPGFVKLRNDFTNNIKKAIAATPVNEETVKKYCKSFVDEIGSLLCQQVGNGLRARLLHLHGQKFSDGHHVGKRCAGYQVPDLGKRNGRRCIR